MIAISASSRAAVLPQPTLPVRSPRTSIILAELARQRRWERHQRHQRRKARARRAVWLALFNRKPFDLISVQRPLCVIFSGAMPMVYAPPRPW
jgi:DNA-binding transcriptional MocR family regulator